MPRRPFKDARVKAVFDGYRGESRRSLLRLRGLIFETAAETERVGALVETLKWGQPAYLPAKPRIGSTIRIDALGELPTGCVMFVHCQTTLIADFRERYGELLTFEGNRAVLLPRWDEVSREALQHCIALALTYHLKPRA